MEGPFLHCSISECCTLSLTINSIIKETNCTFCQFLTRRSHQSPFYHFEAMKDHSAFLLISDLSPTIWHARPWHSVHKDFMLGGSIFFKRPRCFHHLVEHSKETGAPLSFASCGNQGSSECHLRKLRKVRRKVKSCYIERSQENGDVCGWHSPPLKLHLFACSR